MRSPDVTDSTEEGRSRVARLATVVRNGHTGRMTVEMALWRADDQGLTRLTPTRVVSESQLEDHIEKDPTILGRQLLLVGRQVKTDHGGVVDLLAVDAEGTVHVIELKRDRTTRDVVAQTLDYASWAAELSHTRITELFEEYRPGTAFDAAFVECFGGEPPENLNENQTLTIVTASVDPATERIVRYLNTTFNVPVNVVFFLHFEDNGGSYLARTWLVTEDDEVSKPATKQRTLEVWNKRDWYVAFGETVDGRSWEDARTFGFVSAGGGSWYSQKLKNLPIGARIFTCIPQRGYVGVGIVTAEAVRFDEAVVTNGGRQHRLKDLPLKGRYRRNPAGDTDEDAEYAVAVTWLKTVPVEDAVWKTGMFANQNPACKLRKQFTIDTVVDVFGLSDVD